MVRMKVDLPEPDGPMMTITSPRFTVRLMPRNAWKVAKPFLHVATDDNDFILACRWLMLSSFALNSVPCTLTRAFDLLSARPHPGFRSRRRL
jgi:hypothetical protein